MSPELRTVGLLRPHVLVGYQWSHTGLHSGRKTSHNRYIRSFVSQSPQNRTGTFQCIRLKHGTTPPARYDRVQFHWPTTPLTGRGCPSEATWSLLRQCRLPPWVSTVARAAPAGSGQFRRQICFAPYVGWLSVHDHPHPREVSSLSRGVMSQPLFDPLRADLRFLPRPLPAASSVRLTAGLPVGEDYGLTTLHPGNLRGLGPASTPVARHLRRMSEEHPDLATHHFGPSLSAPLARLQSRRSRRFTWVGPTTHPWSQTTAVLAVATSVHTPVAIRKDMGTLSRGLRTPLLPGTHASVGDCWQNSRCRHLL